MSIKNLVEMIKRNGLLASMPQLEELYQVAIENELKLADSQREFRAADATIENLQMQVEKLTAENAFLKGVVSGINNELYGQGFMVSGWHQNGALESLDNWFTDNGWGESETPATDAFLAEVRAQGVEMFGQYHNFSEKLLIQKEAKKFAALLRKGVQS
ncbi:hypothetical protein [Enterobacter mori]|uniref:hypothetical protein n=1 Tax=Enterobacter mori TaxID=539813 RepID=UPI0021CABE03|nr:hypothetical protein [Enterobacter mori]MCU3986559.1 hypothetical protein [Enterobacter mori]